MKSIFHCQVYVLSASSAQQPASSSHARRGMVVGMVRRTRRRRRRLVSGEKCENKVRVCGRVEKEEAWTHERHVWYMLYDADRVIVMRC